HHTLHDALPIYTAHARKIVTSKDNRSSSRMVRPQKRRATAPQRDADRSMSRNWLYSLIACPSNHLRVPHNVATYTWKSIKGAMIGEMWAYVPVVVGASAIRPSRAYTKRRPARTK